MGRCSATSFNCKDSSFPSLSIVASSFFFFFCLKFQVSSLNSTSILALPTLEAFTMLNYWRTSGGGAATLFTGKSRPTTNNTHTHTLVPFSDYGFDGPFFDLEFTRRNLSESDEEIELNLDQTFGEHTKLPPSLPKFRLLLPKFKKPNGVVEKTDKFVRVKFKVDQVKGPLISLFARDISIPQDSTTSPANKVLQRHLNILKPLSVRLHGGGDADSPPSPGARSSNLQAGLRVVRKHFGKSRSSSAAASVSPPGSNRRDDSLLDGIEGAILHCKRSFNSEREGGVAIFSGPESDDPCSK